jgi:CRISPR type I-E-associated protein CasB/Cse2
MDSGTGTFVEEAHIAKLAAAVQACRPGDQADLRRMLPASPPLVFYRLLLRHIPDARNRREYERAWVAIMQGMALLALSGGEAHDRGQSLGKALGGMFSESGQARFWRLLQARGETFYDLLRHILRMLAQKRLAVNWTDIADLCLWTCIDDLGIWTDIADLGLLPEKRREDCCRRLARDFCRTQGQQFEDHSPENPEEAQGAAS